MSPGEYSPKMLACLRVERDLWRTKCVCFPLPLVLSGKILILISFDKSWQGEQVPMNPTSRRH